MAEAKPMVKRSYPFTGANFAQYGEVPGYVYWPWTDEYYVDPQAVQGYVEQNNLVEKPQEAPGLLSQLAPVAGAGLAMGIGQGLAKDPSGFLGGIKDTASGLFNLTGGETAASEAANVAASAPVQQAASTTGSGLFGLGAEPAIASSVETGAPMTASQLASGGSPGLFSGIGAMPTLPLAGVAAGIGLGAKGLMDTFKGDDTKGALDWASRGTIGIATGGLSEAYRGLRDAFGSGKGKDQQARDSARANGFGFLYSDPEREQINLGGGRTIAETAINPNNPNASFNVDFDREGMGAYVGALNPLAEIASGGDDKLRGDFAGIMANAVASGGNPGDTIKNFYANAGYDKNTASQALTELKNQGKITEEEYRAYLYGLGTNL